MNQLIRKWKIEARFAIDPGKTVRVQIVDDQKRPIENVQVVDTETGHGFPKGSHEFEATGLLPGKAKIFRFTHLARNLGTTATISAEDVSPVVVRLKPLAKVVGKLVDGDGEPVRGARVIFGRSSARLHSDENGRFEKFVMPGDYNLVVQSRTLISRSEAPIEVNENEHLDLGTIDVSKQSIQIKPNRRPQNQNDGDADRQRSKPTDARAEESRFRTISGVIYSADYQPLPNHKVQFKAWRPYPRLRYTGARGNDNRSSRARFGSKGAEAETGTIRLVKNG